MLYEAHSGEIRIFGRPVASFTANQIANDISYVAQDVALFSGTIYENLTCWKNNITNAEITQAIQDTGLSLLIHHRGLHGRVEEYGKNFSGGEIQRIEIARALLQNTPILILDEATSALDSATEKAIISNLRRKNKTIIFVTHRLFTTQHCDQIFVFENGEIIERGNHAELMKIKNRYYHLFQSEISLLYILMGI